MLKNHVVIAILCVLAVVMSRHAAASCLDTKNVSTFVNVNYVVEDPTYDYTKDVEALTTASEKGVKEWQKKNKADLLSSTWGGRDMVTKGYAHSGIYGKVWMTFIPQKYDYYGINYCVFLGQVNIELNLSTVIYVAKEVYEDKCYFPHVLKHEEFHHEISSWSIEDTAKKLKKDIYDMVEYLDRQPAIEKTDIQFRQDYLKEALQDVLKVYIGDFSKMNDVTQSQLDTVEEYERISKIGRECKQKKGAK